MNFKYSYPNCKFSTFLAITTLSSNAICLEIGQKMD